jgi:hypothetical protein
MQFLFEIEHPRPSVSWPYSAFVHPAGGNWSSAEKRRTVQLAKIKAKLEHWGSVAEFNVYN